MQRARLFRLWGEKEAKAWTLLSHNLTLFDIEFRTIFSMSLWGFASSLNSLSCLFVKSARGFPFFLRSLIYSELSVNFTGSNVLRLPAYGSPCTISLNWRKTDMLSLENSRTCYVEIYCSEECKSNFPARSVREKPIKNYHFNSCAK